MENPTAAAPPIESPPQSKNAQMTSAITQLPDDPVATSSLFDWSEFLEFSLDDHLNISFDSSDQQPQQPDIPSPQPPITAADPGRVRKRDPRMVCSNFLAGRIPCACPELDEQLEEEELAALGSTGKKKPRTAKASAAGQSIARCQVPGCETDISELKGYHRRHRVCLSCANAVSVVLDGESKRYCQQCGKFHVLLDFDEGKRSCRRKLERHNNRRRRKSADSKGSAEKEPHQVLVADEGDFDEDSSKDGTGMDSQIIERELREVLLESEGHLSTLSSTVGSQTVQSDSIRPFAASGEEQSEKEKENLKNARSPSYCDNRSALSSVCPTGRISFKLYDWNPAEFPRRLRHQIFQWLASMPVELEGYIRPGCTILTLFIAMPHFKWAKLLEEPAIQLRDLMLSPGNMLLGRGTFLVYLNNMVFRATKGGTSITKVKLKGKTPKLYYVHPTCFEAGKPLEFFVCGSNLLQSKFRFLVSFSEKYLANDFRVSPCCKIEGDSSSLDHQLLKVIVPQTNVDLFGPAFIEVENESGLSNFVPILIADKDICAEMEKMLEKLNRSLHPRGSEFASSCPSCEHSILRDTELSDFMLDVAWLLREPVVESTQLLTSTLIQRFRRLLNLLIENESTSILERALSNIKIVMDNGSDAGIAESELNIFCGTMDAAQTFLSQRLIDVRESLVGSCIKDARREMSSTQIYKNETRPVIQAINQDVENNMCKSESRLTFVDDSSTAPLLTMTSVDLKERPWKSCNPSFGKTVLTSRPLVFAITAVAVCFGVCAVALHPSSVGEFTTTIRRCLFDNS